MLLVAAWIEGGVFKPFDPRPYPAQFMLHSSEERYRGWLDSIGQVTSTPQPGDVVCYMFGRCFSHAAIIIDDDYLVHAFAEDRHCCKTERNWTSLRRIRGGLERPFLYYDMWARLRE